MGAPGQERGRMRVELMGGPHDGRVLWLSREEFSATPRGVVLADPGGGRSWYEPLPGALPLRWDYTGPAP